MLDKNDTAWIPLAKGYTPKAADPSDEEEVFAQISEKERHNTSRKELLRFYYRAESLAATLYGLTTISQSNLVAIYSELCLKNVSPDEIFDYVKQLGVSMGMDLLTRQEAHLKMMVDLMAKLPVGDWPEGSLNDEAYTLFHQNECEKVS